MAIRTYKTGDAGYFRGMAAVYDTAVEYFASVSNVPCLLHDLTLQVPMTYGWTSIARSGSIWIYDYSLKNEDVVMVASAGLQLPVLRNRTPVTNPETTILKNQLPTLGPIIVTRGAAVSIAPPSPIPFSNGILVVASKFGTGTPDWAWPAVGSIPGIPWFTCFASFEVQNEDSNNYGGSKRC